ncbi:MAG: SDR family oxidoreductase [Pseudomonadota bacterium]
MSDLTTTEAPDRPVQARRTVAITGASAGIGRATVRVFAQEGWRVGLIARDEERLERTAEEVRALGGEPIVCPADVADAEAIEAAADRIAEAGGGIDLWINNAMTTVYGRVVDLTPREFARVTEVVYLGAVYGTMAALKHMRAADAGTIVQVGSALAHRAIPLQSAYCGAKYALRGFTDSLRAELEHEASPIRLSMVQLPGVNTPQFSWCRSKLPRRPEPVPPLFEPEAAAEAIRRAADEAPRELWVGGPSLQLIVGGAVAPGFMDKMLSEQAWSGQMTDEPQDGVYEGNLFEPVPGDYRAAGKFGDQARPDAVYVNPTTLRTAGLAAAGTLAVGALSLLLSGRRRA